MLLQLRTNAMTRPIGFAWLAVFAGGCLWLGGISSSRGDEHFDGIEFFERKVRPVLARRCYECHSHTSKHLQGELSLDTRAGLLHGGESGPAIVPGEPGESLLVQAVGYDGDTQMPPSGKLSAEEIALLTEWVQRGAPLPDDGSAQAAKKPIDFEAGRRFWSFQPPRMSELPLVQRTAWPERRIDTFLLAALEQRGLEPSAEADARTLIRRASFDLVGLPPSAEEVEAFANDRSPDAYQRLVERLLASPHYGERWGRYWLDLARYADGNETSLEVRPRAWLYRDWIVQALNDDLPYDQFVLRQLAADQLPGCQPADLAALGFLGISPIYFKELKLSPAMIKTIVADEWEERIDAVGRTFLGLSLACARCHDHKFDPVSTADYYALAGVLASTRLVDRYVIAEPQAAVVRAARKQIQELEKRIAQVKSDKQAAADRSEMLADLNRQIKEIEQQTPNYSSALAHGVDDAALHVLPDGPDHTKLDYKPGEALDLHVQIRGNPAKPGPRVPRHFLTVLSTGTPQPFTRGSGRLELAEAIVGEGAPLSARVIVNRIWKQHFGRGLVETTSDFGAQGARPSHPELLDDLTCRFIEHGWSLKWLHREIMLSAAYRQASAYDAWKTAIDPENRLLWRMSRRRLDVEAWRDAILVACGTWDGRLGGPPLTLADANNRRRTIYAKINRADVDPMLRLFDFPDPSNHSPNREPTTTALQQLFVLNSPFMTREAAALAERMAASGNAAEGEVRAAYRLLFARSPTASELHVGIEFLTGGNPGASPSRDLCRQYAQALLASNEFLFVD